MVRQFLRWIGSAKKKIKDPYTSESYTWRSLLVPEPTLESPFPCILVSLSNGHSKILIRFRGLAEYRAAFELSEVEAGQIMAALKEADKQSAKIEDDIRLILKKRDLKPGEAIINATTGEIIAEAERIIKDGGRE